MAEIVVLGAGPAGLMAALDLATAGHRCVLLEAQGRPGGMSASIEVAGQRVDLGSHRLHPATSRELLAEIGEWLGDDLQTRERNGRIHLSGRWIGFPLRATDMIRNLPPAFAVRAMVDSLTGPLRRGAERSFDDAIRRRLGPAVASDFYAPYAAKLYGVEPGALSVELADRRVSAGGPIDIARRVLRASRPEGRTFLYPRDGYGQIVDRLTERVVAAGVDLRLASPASAITPSGDRFRVSTASGDVEVDLALSSIPPAALARIVDDVPTEVATAMSQVRTRAMVLVYLVVDLDRYTPFDAHYIPDASRSIARLSEPKNYRDGDDPPGQTVLCAEIPCWVGDDVWNANDVALGQLVADDLRQLGLPEPPVLDVASERLPSVYPVLERSTEAARTAVSTWVDGLDGIVSFGRQGLAVPDNLHHVLTMGRSVARAVREDGSFDRDRWAESLLAFETHVVED